MKKQPDAVTQDTATLRDKIVGLSESSGRKSYYQHVEKFLPTSEPKIDIAVILAVINSEKIMHSSENFFKEFDYVRTRMLLFWLYIRRY